MPKNPIDFKNTIIYVIRCLNDESLLYVGSTTNFIHRKAEHKHRCNLLETKLYKTIKDNGGWENFVMVEHSKFPCENKQEAHKEEERVRLELKSKLNTIRAFTTKEQSLEQLKYNPEKYQSKKNDILKKMTCECGCVVAKSSYYKHIKTQKHINFSLNPIEGDEQTNYENL
jgi:predicted GIY-YIG superfamily endonuclease